MHIKGASKVIGYFSYVDKEVFCDNDACIIAGSEELMKSYLQRTASSNKVDIIKKTRFGEIINGLRQGCAYAFDEEAYNRFLHFAKLNGMNDLPSTEFFSTASKIKMNFLRIQLINF